MAVFRDFRIYPRNPLLKDQKRHQSLIEKTIKNNIPSLMDRESILTPTEGRRVKLVIQELKEYQFIYRGAESQIDMAREEGNKGTFHQDLSEGGNREGEDIYEMEVNVGEVLDSLLKDLSLPNLEEKPYFTVPIQSQNKKKKIRTKGAFSRLSKKHTAIERIKRKQKKEKDNVRIPFYETDLRYFYKKPNRCYKSNGVVFCIMDTSGSMGEQKKYLAKGFYFLLYQFLKKNYEQVEIVFISHTTKAKEVSEKEFFYRGESGGTYMSSGYTKALEIIHQRYPKRDWNIYAFHCSDGDNWGEDNEQAVQKVRELCRVCHLVGYGEIKTGNYNSSIMKLYQKHLQEPNFTMVQISDIKEIWNAFITFLQEEKDDSQ